MKKGVQMYAIRSLASVDLEKALETVSEIGYEGVEFAGFFDHSAEEVAGWLKKYGLTALGAHVAPELMLDKPEEVIAYHKMIGNHRIICPWYDLKNKEDVAELAEKIKKVAPLYRENGMYVYYHNHAHEFEKDGESYLIDLLAEQVSESDLRFEFDIYWVYRGGECPVKYMKKYKDRTDLFHAKDGIGDKGTTLSEGAVDVKAVFEFANSISMQWAVAESEACDEADEQVEAIRKDFQALLKLI